MPMDETIQLTRKPALNSETAGLVLASLLLVTHLFPTSLTLTFHLWLYKKVNTYGKVFFGSHAQPSSALLSSQFTPS